MTIIEDIARRARGIARANYDASHTNLGTWEDAVVHYLAIQQAINEIGPVSRGGSQEPQGTVGG